MCARGTSRGRGRASLVGFLLLVVLSGPPAAGEPADAAQSQKPPGQAPPAQAGQAKPAVPAPPPAPAPPQPGEQPPPTEATLGLPIYPAAQFLASYDAGRGQRYYLFGTTAAFAEVVGFYKNILRQKGELVFEQPPTHVFEVGRFREDAVAFPPGVTVKDYAWSPARGYPNPKPGAQPDRFPTIIQFVPYVAPPR